MEFINQLPSNPLAWILLSSCTILSTFLAIYFGIKSLPRKKLKVTFRSNELITNKQSALSKLSVLYDGISVEQLTVTKITFWNNAFSTINNADIIEADPFSVFSETENILDVSILGGDNSSNLVNISAIENNKVIISFDYLDRKEGGILQVIHTGNKNSIKVSKKIKGGNIITYAKKGWHSIILLISFAFLSAIFFTVSEKMFSLTPLPSILAYLTGTFSVVIITNLDKDFVPKNCIHGGD